MPAETIHSDQNGLKLSPTVFKITPHYGTLFTRKMLKKLTWRRIQLNEPGGITFECCKTQEATRGSHLPSTRGFVIINWPN